MKHTFLTQYHDYSVQKYSPKNLLIQLRDSKRSITGKSHLPLRYKFSLGKIQNSLVKKKRVYTQSILWYSLSEAESYLIIMCILISTYKFYSYYLRTWRRTQLMIFWYFIVPTSIINKKKWNKQSKLSVIAKDWSQAADSSGCKVVLCVQS